MQTPFLPLKPKSDAVGARMSNTVSPRTIHHTTVVKTKYRKSVLKIKNEFCES